MIGKIERVPLREVWKHEAADFTQWLQDNIDVLNEVIDLNLSNPEREQAAGSFSIDIVAEERGLKGTLCCQFSYVVSLDILPFKYQKYIFFEFNSYT